MQAYKKRKFKIAIGDAWGGKSKNGVKYGCEVLT